IAWLAGHHQADAARAVLEKEIADATESAEKDRDDVGLVLRLNAALRVQGQLAGELYPAQTKALRDRYRSFLSREVEAHPEEVSLVGAYLNAHLLEIQDLVLTDPDEAERIIDSVRKFIKEFKDPRPAVRRRLKATEQNLAAFASSLQR